MGSGSLTRLQQPVAEACQFGRRLRVAAMAVNSTSAHVMPVPSKAKKARNGKGRSKRGSQAQAKIAQVPLDEVQTHADVDVVTVPDGQGGHRRVHLSKFRTLMLDSSYRPVSVINWQKAVRHPHLHPSIPLALDATEPSQLRRLEPE